MPTIFDASLEDQKKKQAKVEKELADIQEQARQKSQESTTPQESIFEASQENIDPLVIDHSEIEEEHLVSDNQISFEESDPGLTQTDVSENTPMNEKKKNSRQPEDYSELLRNEKPSNAAFSAFMPQPPGVGFESQHENEKILLVLRQHPVVNLTWILITIVLILAPFLLFPLIPLQIVLPGNFLFFLMVAWYLFVTVYAVESFLGWYFNIYVITDERIIDIDFYSLIYKSVSEAKLDKIEDVTATTAGFFGAFFNFGNITIQTAAEQREFDFQKVPQPAKVTKFLNELMLEEGREKIEGRVM